MGGLEACIGVLETRSKFGRKWRTGSEDMPAREGVDMLQWSWKCCELSGTSDLCLACVHV